MTASYIPVTVIILTQDEEINIQACLESVVWSDDVILVDSGSQDQTLSFAKSTRPDVRIFSHPFQDFGDQRNWALDRTDPKHEWILFIDADERITPACATAIGAAVGQPGANVGYYLAPRNYFLGHWIRRCSLYPSWQLRLLKKGAVRFQKEGHGQREVTDGPLGYIYEPYDHFGFSKGIAEWMERHSQYATNETELIRRLRNEQLRLRELFDHDPVIRRRCLKRLAARIPCRSLTRFLYLYVFCGGFLDGRAGLTFCMLRMGHETDIAAKLGESRMKGTSRAWRGLREHVKWALFPGINLHARQRYVVLRRFLGAAQHGTERCVLDAGCGNGMLSYRSFLLGNRVLGVSIKKDEVIRCKRLFNEHLGIPEDSMTFRALDLYNIESVGSTYDEIICSEVLEHIVRDAAVCRSFARILKPGGILHLCCPNAEHPDNARKELDAAEQGGHVRPGYTMESYRSILEPAGFQLTDSYGLGGPVRQAFNKRITAAQERYGFVAGFLVFLFAIPWLWLDPCDPPIPYSIYVRAVRR